MSFSAKKALISAAGIMSVIFASLVGISPANAAPQTMANASVSIARDIQNDGTVKLAPGKSIFIRGQFTSSSFNSDGIKSLSSNFAVTPQANLMIASSPTYYWRIDGCPMPNTYNTATTVPCAASTGVYGTVEYSVTNNGISVLDIATNVDSASVTYGGSAVSGSFTLNPSTRKDSGTLSTSIAYDKTNGDDYVTLNFFVCFDSTKASNGDALTVTKTENFNGNPVVSSSRWTIGYSNETLGSTWTYNSTLYGSGSALVMAGYSGFNTDGPVSYTHLTLPTTSRV